MKGRLAIPLVVLALVLAGLALLARGPGGNGAPDGSGTVEARNVRVGSKAGGRVAEVLVREGDRVVPGQLLVTFEDRELRAALDEARAVLEKTLRGPRPEEVAESRAAAAHARAEYEQRLHGSRKEEIAAAKAEADRARAEAELAGRNFRRYERLAETGAVARKARDDAEAAWKMAAAARKVAEEKLARLENGYRPEEIAAARARSEQAEAAWTRVRNGNRREDIDAARARLLGAEARFREREVRSPSEAVVEVLDVRPGDLVPPNAPVATLLERKQVYVRIYVPETRIGEVRAGRKADVRLDALPGRTIAATVEQVNQEAEFLPRNIQTKEERVHQVFGVRLRIEDPEGLVRPGMAADVTLRPAGK